MNVMSIFLLHHVRAYVLRRGIWAYYGRCVRFLFAEIQKHGAKLEQEHSHVFSGVGFPPCFGVVVSPATLATWSIRCRNLLWQQLSIPPLWFTPLDDPMKLAGVLLCGWRGTPYRRLCNEGHKPALETRLPRHYLRCGVPRADYLPADYYLMGTEIFEGIGGFYAKLSDAAVIACAAVVVVCMVGIILTGGRESKAWSKRIMKGLYALYNNLSGWLSDILSYSRLLALGLCNRCYWQRYEPAGRYGGWQLAVCAGFLVYPCGVPCWATRLNFGINVLGAYVHSNRLEYVEFFGKFYEGGGRKFTPFGVHNQELQNSLRRKLKMSSLGIVFAVVGMALASLLPGFGSARRLVLVARAAFCRGNRRPQPIW